ncbi:MAG: M14 family zinc carboxypeptidase, partial [Bacteroidota bacterium]
GDETAGYWLLLQLAEYLLAEDHTGLLREIEVYLNPLANPDGTFHRGNHTLVGATRGNANGVDLNRNYPDPDDGPHPDGYDYQPETKIFMQAARNHSFDMALNIHGGAEVFNYPWDTYRQRHPDTDWWRRISRDFASRVQTASTRSGYFQDRHNGVTNGHDWYPIAGSRQDYMNFFHRCREATLEVSNRKQFPASQLPKIWRYTRPALLGYLNEARFGAHGFVRDRVTGKPVKALVQVPGHDAHNSDIYADRNHGNFHRYLAAGDYQMLFSAPGYVPQWQSVKVRDGRKSEVNVWLEPLNSSKEEVTRKR